MAFFDVAADAYVAFMGRFSTLLSGPFADLGLAGVDRSARVLDVGCGPGVLTGELVGRRGAGLVSAVDPADAFVEAAAAAYPDADVRTASAEALPYDDGVFGAALAQLVVHFMKEPVAGLAEMARVTAPGGRVSACVWDHAGGRSPVSAFWRIVTEHDPDARDQGRLPGTVEGELGRFLTAAGLLEVEETTLEVRLSFATFEEWWRPFTYGVGPAGAYVAGLNKISRAGLEGVLREEVGPGPIDVEAVAWAATGIV